MDIIEEIREKKEYGYSDEQIAILIGIGVEDVKAIGLSEVERSKVVELEEKRKRAREEKQRKGIEEAKERGVKFGREIQYGKDEKEVNKVMTDYDRGYITWREAAERLGMSKKSTFFYRYYKWKTVDRERNFL